MCFPGKRLRPGETFRPPHGSLLVKAATRGAPANHLGADHMSVNSSIRGTTLAVGGLLVLAGVAFATGGNGADDGTAAVDAAPSASPVLTFGASVSAAPSASPEATSSASAQPSASWSASP